GNCSPDGAKRNPGSPASGLSFPGLRCASSGLQAGRDDDGHKKGPGRNRGLMSQTDKLGAYLSRFLSAVPRISPSVAPESEEPYCAMASFSSATSSALIETCTLRAFLSNWITRSSTFSPTATRSAR